MKTKPKPIAEVAESMKSASALWGIPAAVLKAAKAAGCPAFRQQRVHRKPLVEWLREHPETAGEGERIAGEAELRRRRLAAQIELLELNVARAKGEVIDRAYAQEEWSRAASICQAEARLLLEADAYRIWVTRVKDRIGQILP